ncbi:hypothetical protein RchiOBHm_Chr1g0379211 [Rosa chinensis]|uniref:Uncharacterized protein n=1 Tax=Rosa chinensis TaxID=74649 RepID=A0A2P6SNI3_ROSCH|nr:hypothetical protein RchiOBHm_Chr1g0379211 [Rosa chinensis]
MAQIKSRVRKASNPEFPISTIRSGEYQQRSENSPDQFSTQAPSISSTNGMLAVPMRKKLMRCQCLWN